MPFVPVPGVISCAIRATLYDIPIQTDFNFASDNFITNTIIVELLDALQLYWQTEALPLLPNSYRYISIYGYDAGEQEGAAADITPAGNDIGLYPGIPLPANVSLFFNSRVGTRKRGNSGGIYWPCFVETDVTANQVSTTMIDSILLVLNGMVGVGAVAADTNLVAVSKWLNNAPRAVGVSRPIATWVANDTRVDSMRRRLS